MQGSCIITGKSVFSFIDKFFKKGLNQLKLPDYVEVSYDRFCETENIINNNKGLTTRIKDKSGKVINIGTKDATGLMNLVSKDEIAYHERKTIFNNKIVKSADVTTSEKPSYNRTRLLKIFLDLGEVFSGRF